jgi:DNA-binding IclR family transcriptional regulator
VIPFALSQAKADPRFDARTRVLLWCVATNTAVAPKCDAAAHELQIPRSTAADAIRDLVRGGYLERAA